MPFNCCSLHLLSILIFFFLIPRAFALQHDRQSQLTRRTIVTYQTTNSLSLNKNRKSFPNQNHIFKKRKKKHLPKTLQMRHFFESGAAQLRSQSYTFCSDMTTKSNYLVRVDVCTRDRQQSTTNNSNSSSGGCYISESRATADYINRRGDGNLFRR